MGGMRRGKKARRRETHSAKPAKANRAASKAGTRGRVVTLTITPERMLERAARRFVKDPSGACVKCGSTFIAYEPAFIHCHYCGNMARIANASLAAQDLFELRLGLRLAS
jgi:hypothetical protein